MFGPGHCGGANRQEEAMFSSVFYSFSSYWRSRRYRRTLMLRAATVEGATGPLTMLGEPGTRSLGSRFTEGSVSSES